jgi:hypothetical protein
MPENRTRKVLGSHCALSKFDFEAGSIDRRNSPVRLVSTNSSKTFLPMPSMVGIRANRVECVIL